MPVNEKINEKNEMGQSPAAYFCVGMSLDPWKLSRRLDPVIHALVLGSWICLHVDAILCRISSHI